MTAHAQRAPGTGRRPGAHPSRHTAAPPVTLMGELTGTRFKNADNGFFIGTLKTDGEEGKPESTPIVGTSPAGIPRLGAFLALDGAWVEDPKYGRQFRFSALREEVPPSTDGMATYLAKYTGGIGEKRARSIIERFGADAFQIITDHPERLIGIAGITGDLAVQIQAAFQAAAADREALTTLHGWEIGPAGINAIKDAWEGDLLAAVHAIKVNPYLLSKHVAGFGFIRSDRVALKAGVPLNSPFRHAAAILHCLEEAASDGHTWLSRLRIVKGWRGFKDAKCGLLNLLGSDPGGDAISLALSELVRDGSVEALALGYALPRLVQAEQAIAEKVRALMKQGEKPSSPIPLVHFEHLNDGQVDAYEKVHADGEGLVVITGGAGTGKTTVLKAILDTAQTNNLVSILCAPTGKAAKRMTEATGRPASTIHRLLQWGPEGPNLNDLAADLLVVDEASMVDVELMAALLERIHPERTRLLLVGDANQLPPVGPGAPFRDIIAACPEQVARLTEIMRTAADSVIPHNAQAVLDGNADAMRLANGTQMLLAEIEDPAEAAAGIAAACTPDRLREVHHVEPEDLQVLSPMKKGPLGTATLNERLREVLNLSSYPALEHFEEYRVGDRVIFTRNNYDAGYLNGDQGYVLSEQKEAKKAAELLIAVDGETVKVGRQDLGDLQLGYAITVHKSQGSEWPMVVVAVHTTHTIMLQRTLLYTAITRGKSKVVLVGTRDALRKAVREVSSQGRATLLPGLLSIEATA